MTTKMNLNGTTRKALVAAIAEITGEKAIYRAMPTCSISSLVAVGIHRCPQPTFTIFRFK